MILRNEFISKTQNNVGRHVCKTEKCNNINISNDNPQMRVVHSAARLHKTDTVESFSFKVLTKLTVILTLPVHEHNRCCVIKTKSVLQDAANSNLLH